MRISFLNFELGNFYCHNSSANMGNENQSGVPTLKLFGATCNA